MKKRVLSLFMALALCLTMLPTAAFAETSDAAAQTAGGTADTGSAYTIDKALRAESSEHAHCVCGVKGCEKWLVTASGSHTKTISFSDHAISQDAEGLKINGTVWEKRELKTSDNAVVGYYYRLPAGDYYLTTDLDLEDAYIATATGTVNLCLNGHSIQTTAKRTICVSNERTTATLNLCDCKRTSGTYGEITHTSGASGVGVEVRTENKFNMYGGRITGNNRSGVDTSGGYFTMYGGEITGNSISNSDAQGGGGVTIGGQSFTMYGGSISNNSADYGGGVGWYSYGKFYMYGGEITDNTATTAGGGVYTRNDRVYVKGAVKITGNSTTDGKANNVCLGSVSGYPSDYFVLDGALKEGSKLGVTLGSGHDGLITKGWKAKMPDVTADQLTDYFISDASGMKFDLNSAGEVTLTAIPHKHLLCGTACSHGGEQHTKILTWTAVSDLTKITRAGHYYLTQDIETTNIWVPANGVVLCLNGHSIINTNHGYTIMVRKDYTFTLCDCKGDSAEYGRITHAEQADGTKYSGRGVYAIGTFNMYGGSISGNVSPDSSGVLLDNGANSGGKGTAFNMYGGEITGNTATSGAGGGVYVFANSPFRMYGGSISGNTAKYGGGVYVGSGSVFTVSGSVTITGNTDNDGSACNVQLAKGNTAGMTFAIGEGGLAESARIGVTADAAPAIGEHIAVATGADNGYYEGSITSDAGGQYGILREGDEINLYNGLPHKHLLCGTACSHGGETHTDVLTWTAVSSLSEITKAGHYYLTQSVTQSSEWQPVDGVVLCLNGYDIICSKDGANTIKLANGGSFTLSDCKGTGRITHTDGLTGTGVYLDPDGTFTMYGGSISGNSAAEKGGGVYMTRSTFRMLGGSVSGNKAKYGGGVYVYSGVFTLSGGTVSGNSSDEDGAGVYTAGTFNMTGGSVSGNFTTDAAVTGFATKRGGGVYAAYVFNMSGGTISGNTAAEYGGGVYVILSAACTITGGTISGNTSGNSKGGGVCAGNKLTVSGAPCITGNLGKDGAANNVYLGRREIIHVGGALESGASIGVTTADPVIDGSYVRVADGTGLAADTTSYFTSDAYPGCTKRLMGDSVIFSSGTLHEHAVCGRSDCTDAAHGNTAWIPLTSVDGKLLYGGANASKNGDSYMLYAGNYYLAADIELDGRLFLAGDVNLCLNGKQITTTNTSVSAVVDDHWGLTLCDCRGNGRIAAPGETVNGVSSSQSFTMYGGTISGGRYGAYIYDDHGAFRMLGGKITGSQTGIYRNSSRNSLTIGGDANVTGSTRNVYLDSGVLTIDPSLTQAARIGITTSRQPTDDVPVQFAAGASSTALDYTKIFLPDASGQGYVVMQEQDKLYLRKHQHSWAYTASGTTITAACTNADGTCPDTNGGSVTLSAPDQTLFYNGMARAASCTSSLTTGDAAIITYYAKPADTTALSGAPVNAGDYIARIQLGEASVSVSYTIEKVRLLVTANSTVIDYGTAPMHDGVSCQGFVNNEDIDDLDGTLTYAHTYRQFGDVGEYTITPGGLTSDNYDISFLPGTLEVRPRTVTLTWHNTEGRIYADDEGAITATVSNAVNGDRIGVTVTGGELTAGTHTAAATGLTGDKANNYQLSTVDADRTVQYTVAQAAQTLTFAQQGSLTRTYGDDAFSNAASNNRRDGGSITYASSRESVATVASDGTVTIHAAGEATITATAAETANYQQSAASYTLRVSPKGVTITGLQAESKTYDGTAAAVITGTPALSGLMAGDDVTVDAARAAAAFADADAGTGKTVLLSGYALTGADAANYTLIAQPTGITADITKAAITVTPDAGQGKTYGEDDPTLTFAVSAAANGESPAFDGALTRASGENAGSYAIAIGSLKLADRGAFKADNYTLALAPDTVYFRIDRAPHADVTASGAAMYGNPGSVDLRSLIADGGAASLGDVTDTDSVLDGAPAVSGSTLRFAFRNEPANADKTAVIAVHVNGADNYLDYTITVTVTVDSRIVPTGQPTLTPAAITYGQPLRTIALSGALRDGDTVVEGTFVWNTPDVILPAGSQTAEWTFTPSGSRYATTSGTASVTVREAALTDVSVRQDGALTYTGTALSAPVITSAATVDGSAVTFTYSLAKDGAYGDAVPALTDVAAHTVWYKAEAANHETVTGSFTVTIGKAALTSVSVRQDGALAYNGKAQTARMAASAATVDGSAVTFTYSAEENGIYGPAVPAFSAAGTYTVWYKAEAASHEAVTGSVDITIDKGVLPDPTVTVDVTNNYAAAYSVDLRAVLDAILPTGCQLGAVEYGGLNFEGDETYYDVMRSTLSNKGVLTLAINAVDTDTEGLAATVRVIVTTGSYQDITITVRLNAVNKTVPAGGPTLSRTTLDYGQRLGTIRLSGAMQDGDTVVKGVFTWAEPSLCPASGSYDAEWLFTPEDDSRYAAVSGTSAITVNAPAGKTYNVGGTVLEYGITGSSEQPLEGAVVTIRRGMDIYGQSQATDADGHFHIGQLLPGTYNAVIAYSGKTVTAKLQIVDKDAVLTVRIPREDVSSELEIADPTDLTEHTVVGGLDAEAEKQFSDMGDASVALSMTIREQPQDDSSAAQNAIRELVKNKTLRFVDMTLTMVRDGQLSELKDAGTVLEIILPCDTSRSITVARCHADGNGQAQAMLLTQSTTGAEGTFYVDREGQCIHIFASKFSTYAIGYGRTSNSGHVPDDGEKTSPTTADAGLLAYGIAALGSYTGTALLLRRRKRED
ncbi:MAG: hypothetical protein BHW35_00350 [Firmicutes bacterium CAG:176_63_11]|nr:MAG: hypothetical protein BHW35_00350 [Firmicutes bacterium CAG:176_63_11]